MKYGLQVTGKVRVFAKTRTVKAASSKKTYDVTDHWLNVSEKLEDGSYYNKSMNLLFGREAATPENNQVVIITDSFPIITGSGDYKRIALFVKGWAYPEAEASPDAEPAPTPDEDTALPFDQ